MGADVKAELQSKLGELNAEVAAVLAKRKVFMDANQHAFAEFQIGDEVVNVRTHERGVVTKHYRCWDHQQNPFHDDSFSVECEIRFPRNFIDNTSRFAGSHPFVLASDADARTRAYVWKLESVARCGT